VRRPAGPHVGLCIGVRHDLCALRPEVAVAQPAVVLATGVDDPFDGLRRHLLHRFGDLLRTLKAGTAVDQKSPGGRDHQADVGVDGFVFVGSAFGVTHVGVHVGSDGFEDDLHRLGRPSQGGSQACDQQVFVSDGWNVHTGWSPLV